MRTAGRALDHLVLATPDVAATARWIEESTGVGPAVGGAHAGRGTRNMLCSLGPTSYLEIVGPDLDQAPPAGPRPFGVDDLAAARLVAWAIRVEDIEAVVRASRLGGYDPGDHEPMERRRPDDSVLCWRMTLPTSPIVPFLIDWMCSSHPASSATPGLVLDRLTGCHPDPDRVARILATLDVEMAVAPGPEGLVAEFTGPRGSLEVG